MAILPHRDARGPRFGLAPLHVPRTREGAFVNWAGTVTSTPSAWHAPASESEVVALVRSARAQGALRVVGAGHSWSAIAAPEVIAVSLDRLTGIVSMEGGVATVRAGMRLADLNEALAARGFGLPIVGSIAHQSLAGAIATATHGSSLRHGNLSSLVTGLRLVTGEGEVVALRSGDERLLGARVHLGALGIVTEVSLRVEPAFRLAETIENTTLDAVPAALARIAASAEYVKLWWLPHTTQVQIYRYARTGEPATRRPSPHTERFIDEALLHRHVFPALLAVVRRRPQWIPALNRALARLYLDKPRRVGPSALLLSTPIPVRHRETEAVVPLAQAGEAFARIVAFVAREGVRATFPVELRFVRGDDAWMSPAFGGDVCQIGVYSSATPDIERYFEGVWRELRPLGARPHWGKEFAHEAHEIRALYPAAARFAALRDAFDPKRLFASAFHTRVLGA